MLAKKIMRMTRDKHRIQFFAWSHITGWFLANLQTIWIVWEIRKLMKEIKKLPHR